MKSKQLNVFSYDYNGFFCPKVDLNDELKAFISAVWYEIVRFNITVTSEEGVNLSEYLRSVGEICKLFDLISFPKWNDNDYFANQVNNYSDYLQLMSNSYFMKRAFNVAVNSQKVTTNTYYLAENINNAEFSAKYNKLKFTAKNNKKISIDIFDQNTIINIIYSNGRTLECSFNNLNSKDLCPSIKKIELKLDRNCFGVLEIILLIYSKVFEAFKFNKDVDWVVLNQLYFRLNERVIKGMNSNKFILLGKIKETNSCNLSRKNNSRNYELITFEAICQVFNFIKNYKNGYIDLKPTECINKIWLLEFNKTTKYNKNNSISNGKYSDLTRKELISVQANPRIYSNDKNYKNIIHQLFHYFDDNQFCINKPWWYYKIAAFCIGKVKEIDDKIPLGIICRNLDFI
jgi:hypothetical protein